MKNNTRVIKVPANFKSLMEESVLKRVRMGKDKKFMSMPKAIEKITKHRYFPEIINDFVMEDFNDKK